ncbi:hypothetical protein FACS189493_4060 [Spirochaetia bacterium]|nr:hypothetical protein FACS189493_4060 [Spirochaetia bacterium]
MNKKIVLVIGMAVLTLSFGLIPVFAQAANPVSDFSVRLSDNYDAITITGYKGTGTRVVIAPEYEGIPVTSIGSGAFSYSRVTSVTIPNSVTSIDREAFSVCSSLTSVTLPNGLTSIGDGMFLSCEELTSVTIPNSVTYIGMNAFSGCSSLTSVTLPNGLTSIGTSAFSGCRSLTSVTIPNSVTYIDNAAFSYCRSLTSVTVEDGAQISFGRDVFMGTRLAFQAQIALKRVGYTGDF